MGLLSALTQPPSPLLRLSRPLRPDLGSSFDFFHGVGLSTLKTLVTTALSPGSVVSCIGTPSKVLSTIAVASNQMLPKLRGSGLFYVVCYHVPCGLRPQLGLLRQSLERRQLQRASPLQHNAWPRTLIIKVPPPPQNRCSNENKRFAWACSLPRDLSFFCSFNT